MKEPNRNKINHDPLVVSPDEIAAMKEQCESERDDRVLARVKLAAGGLAASIALGGAFGMLHIKKQQAEQAEFPIADASYPTGIELSEGAIIRDDAYVGNKSTGPNDLYQIPELTNSSYIFVPTPDGVWTKPDSANGDWICAKENNVASGLKQAGLKAHRLSVKKTPNVVCVSEQTATIRD